MSKKKEETISLKEFTKTDAHNTQSGRSFLPIDELLGAKAPAEIDKGKFLLKLKTGKRLEKIVQKIKIKTNLDHNFKGGLVLGPFSKSQVVALCEERLLTKRDELLVPQGTWKVVSDVISEVSFDQLASEEYTSTSSQTGSVTETQTQTQTLTATVNSAPHVEDAVPQPTIEVKVEQKAPPISEAVKRGEATETIVRPVVREPIVQERKKSPSRTGIFLWVFAGVSLVAILAYLNYGFFQKETEKGTQEYSSKPYTAVQNIQNEEWPEYLKAKDFETLKENRSPLLRKLDPILEAYEKGAKVVSEPDMKLLRVLAGPGSSSLEARVLASNMLAALALSKQQTDEARKILDKLLEIVPTDPTTLINRSLTYFATRDYKEAKDFASTALRLCKGQGCWVSRSMLGLIAAEEDRWADVEENFKAALESSRGNLWVQGLRMRAYKNSPKDVAKAKLQFLLTESFILDPDVMVDAPLRAPLAIQIFLNEVVRGYRSALDNSGDSLSQGQKLYIEWILSRLELNPLSISAKEVLDKLQFETATLSQMAASYLEKEVGLLDRSADIVTRTLSRFSGSPIKSSWPWSFAGDVQRSRGLYDQAIIFYEGALSRNPRDVNAVFGLALILREKKEYKASFQKIEEALSLDPDYIPAQLRRDRFEWEKFWLAK
jgi:tetratricopeptide (TPR) repeat protein